MKLDRPRGPPPPPANTTSRALPPPPSARPPPPPPQRNPISSFLQSSFVGAPRQLHAAVALRPPPPPPPPQRANATGSVFEQNRQALAAGVSPAFAQQVKGASTPQLKQLSVQLKMELVLARFTGNRAGAAAAQQKLAYVEGQLHQREVKQELVSRFQYQREVGGMSNEQLTGARSKESQALFVAFLRGDAAGVKEATAKLGVLDAELGKREHALADFAQSLGEMSPQQLDALGGSLAEQFAEVLFSGASTGAQKDSVFNQLAMLMGEHLKRGVKSANTDWMYSK